MAQVKGIYTSGTESRKKKNQTTPVQTAPVVTPKPVKPATVNVPAQTINDARAEQQREQQYRARQSKPAVVPPVKPATVNVPAQTVNDAREEQIRDQRYRRAQSEPVGAGVSGQSKPQTLPVTDEELNRIWYADDPRYQRSQKIREIQEPKSPEALLLDGYWYDDDPDYQALVQAGKLKTVQDLVEELKAREQAEKARDVSAQSAREEQLAA